MVFVNRRAGRRILPALAAVMLLVGARGAAAQTTFAESDAPARVGVALSPDLFKVETTAPALNLRDVAPLLDESRPSREREAVGAGARGAMTPARRERSLGRKILGGAIGGVGGFFGGAYLGAAIEGDRCNCDDPGLMGALIGMPIGALVGAILGVKFM